MPRSSLGLAVIRQRVSAALPSTAGPSFDARRNRKAGTPDVSAASCSRFEAVVVYFATSPTTPARPGRSEEHTSELQSLMRNSYAVFCLKKKKTQKQVSNEKEQ